MKNKVTVDRSIADLETTMAGLKFSKHENGLVKIEDEELGHEQKSLLETLSPPPTPTRRDGASTATLLPMELLVEILNWLPKTDQKSYAACSRVCRQWYFAGTQFLYRYPRIDGKNYTKFVATICPTSTNIKPSPLASLIRILDLAGIVHEGKPSYTARLLRRTQNSLQEFIAPQSSFGYNCIVALGHCSRLRLLDLRLVSQSVVLEDLFRHIGGLPDLVVLHFPRSSVYSTGPIRFSWPQRLEKFALAGSVNNTFLHETKIPATLRELEIAHCPFIIPESVKHLLTTLGPQLLRLSVSFRLPHLPNDALDKVLHLCPNLEYLLVAVDYITAHFFDEQNAPLDHPLKQLDLDSSGSLGVEYKISPDDIFIAVAEERLRSLRIVRMSKRLGWLQRESKNVQDLAQLLEDKARDDNNTTNNSSSTGKQQLGGVWEYESEVWGKRGLGGAHA